MDATAVRAEIKAWERAFKAKYLRVPTVEDIKNNPDIASNYKLYKKLSKDHVATVKSKNEDTPSTPLRPSSNFPGPSSLVPKSRATQSSTDLSTANPFSPTKASMRKAIRQKDITSDCHYPPPHPMTSPNRRHAALRPFTTPSPEPFPLIQAPHEETNLRPLINGNSPAKKARKRLRGDAVSPSPNRLEKKRRMSSIHTGPEASDEDDTAETSFIDESPMKKPSNGKDFKLLFDEDGPIKLDWHRKDVRPARLQSIFAQSDKLSEVKRTYSKNVPTEMNRTSPLPPPLKGSSESANADLKRSPPTGKRFALTTALEISNLPDTLPTRTSRKRSSPEIPDPQTEREAQDTALLPPSPPPSLTNQPGNRSRSSHGTGKGFNQRKKLKLRADDGRMEGDSDGEHQDEISLVEVDGSMKQHGKSRTKVEDEAEDMEREVFGFLRMTRQADAPLLDENESDEGILEIDLPENLRKLLHISQSRVREREERTLVESLLHGGLVSAGERGEVWGVGEIEDATTVITDGEDDWAGEGLPWEAGEL